MASFPFEFEANFEVGNATEWDNGITGTQVAVRDYKYLAKNRKWGVPFRGAYALQASFGVNTDSYVESTDIAITSGSTEHIRFMFYIGEDVSATTTTEVALFQTTPAVAAVGLRIESGGDIKFGVRSNTDALTTSPIVLEKGKWYTAELYVDTTNTNTCTARLPELGIILTTANDVATGAVTNGQLGVIGIGAGSLAVITGTLTLDEFANDSARVYGFASRFNYQQQVTKTSHLFVGPGTIDAVQLLAGAGTDCELSIYDTDSADTTNLNLVHRQTNNTSAETTNYNGRSCVTLHRGAYITLSGTDPQAIITIGRAASYGSEANLRSFASK